MPGPKKMFVLARWIAPTSSGANKADSSFLSGTPVLKRYHSPLLGRGIAYTLCPAEGPSTSDYILQSPGGEVYKTDSCAPPPRDLGLTGQKSGLGFPR